MLLPGNGVFVVQGEMSIIVTAMRRGTRWSSTSHQDDEQDLLLKPFHDLKALLNRVDNLKLINPNIFLEPFLEIIRSEFTTGPVTSLALASVHKFLVYGLIDPEHESSSMAVESIAGAVTRARFVGTDTAADALVLLRILHTLRALLFSPAAHKLSDSAICEVALSCFRICFESRLNELLRRTAEQVLKDMVQLLFVRLPEFSEDSKLLTKIKKIRMRANSMDSTRNKKKNKTYKKLKISENNLKNESDFVNSSTNLQEENNVSTPDTELLNDDIVTTTTVSMLNEETEETISQNIAPDLSDDINNDDQVVQLDNETETVVDIHNRKNEEYVNPRGVRFTPQTQEGGSGGGVLLAPYSIICIRELFQFLISLCNPLDKQNNEVMIHLGLTLLTVAFEIGADNIGTYNSLLNLCKDELCRHLFSLLSTERISIFASVLQVSFLLFESLRTHLKFQLEFYLTKLIDITVSESVKVTYEHKEIALDNIVQLWRIPGLVTELYLNYDCDFYCTNLFEDLTKLLAKNTFTSTFSGIHHTQLLSLDALLTIIESIRANCSAKMEKTDNETINEQQHISIMSSRQKISTQIPLRSDLKAVKERKKWLPQGTEYFNSKPKKGIQFLQDHGILKPELDPYEIVQFLRENPALDKKMIGEYISNRNNLQVLNVFVNSFDFTDLRIDEALRLYLETFRLPGEAPLISLLMEHFADHWHKCNGQPFANADAAFTLAYAVIMLNVDQHNHNVKRQNTPMTADEFKRNLKKVNGGADFDQDMLDEIYSAIKHEEIVMPAEQVGIVRENYLWKVLLRRGASKDGTYIHVPNGSFDIELFNLIWGPTLAALSSIFDKSDDPLIYQRAIKGFEKCAFISSQFNFTNNLDTLILSLCKFTLLNSQQKQTFNATIQFASNEKAQLAFKTLLHLIHLHGDNVRDGWSNIFDLILALYYHKLLPKNLLEAEDFTQPNGKIKLICEQKSLQKTETGLFSSLYSYMLSSEATGTRLPQPEEQELIEYAQQFVTNCNIEQILTESKFLQIESLLKLIDALINFSKEPDSHKSLGKNYNDYVTVFFLELLLRVVIQNRDRLIPIWKTVQDHIYCLIMGAASCDYQYLLERSVIGLLRLAIRLMRNEEMSPIILQSLRMLLLLKSTILLKISRQIACGLFELLKTSAQNIHTDSDWKIVFTLLECIGAGSHVPKHIQELQTLTEQGTKSDGEAPVSSEEESTVTGRGYTSDSELTKTSGKTRVPLESTSSVPSIRQTIQSTNGWILVGNEDTQNSPPKVNQNCIVLERRLGPHNPAALLKCCESLAFLVRDVAHITPYNFEDCVRCIRTFVEASLNGSSRRRMDKFNDTRKSSWRRGADTSSSGSASQTSRSNVSSTANSGDDDSDSEDVPSGYHQVSIQLLDLMHTLHTRTAQIFRWWAEEHGDIAVNSLWPKGWCPLLQGISRLCCDSRKPVRMSAITYLQRALLMPDLQTLSGPEWEACFHFVLFPLLSQLLEPPTNAAVADGLEEARMRAATVLSKVFLHHLTPLLTLNTFSNLWLTILDFMDKYMHAGNSDLLYEAIPESLKNMLLVMDSAKVFNNDTDEYSPLWNLTWERLNTFLPNLKDELFKEPILPELPQSNDTENVSNSNLDLNEIQLKLSQPNIVVTQNDIVNATRNSIILQPPAMDNIASPLFAHLGQMVSTPIGAPLTSSQIIPPYSSTSVQSKIPQSIPQNNTTNNYPIFYSTHHTGLPEPISSQQYIIPQQTNNIPQPLYNDYINNPYNPTDLKSTTIYNPLSYLETNDLPNNVLDTNRNVPESSSGNNDIDSSSQQIENIFPSSNYFYTDSTTEIPPDSEILFQSSTANLVDSSIQSNNRVISDVNIPLLSSSEEHK